MIWSGDFAYAIGLITTDGCLLKDGRHIDLTSKDLEQIDNFKRILKLNNKIGCKNSGSNPRKDYYRILFGNSELYNFLLSIGLCQRKSKLLNSLKIPDRYFADFLRGCFDGDGYSYSYWSKQWPNSFVFYTGFASASVPFLNWMKTRIKELYGFEGYIKTGGGKAERLLMFGKKLSLRLIPVMYHSGRVVCLSRKKFKIDAALGIIQGQSTRGSGEMVNTPS